MSKLTLILGLMGLISISAYGDEKSEFYIEKGLVSKIFKETSSEIAPQGTKPSIFTPMIGIIHPSTLIVSNRYFQTDYHQLDSMPYLYLNIQSSLFRNGNDPIVGSLSVGYGYLQQKIHSKDQSSLEVEDTVSLQWMPMEIGGRYVWSGFSSYSVSPSLDVGLGRIWLHQDGNIDGIDHGTFHSYGVVGSTLEFSMSKDIGFVTQASYQIGIGGSKGQYRGLRLGVGAWLTI